MHTALLLWGVLFSSIGLGLFLYGRKQKAVAPLMCGTALMVVPYLISSTVVLVVVGGALTAVPYFVRR